MNWLTTAQELPVGQKTRSDCPECGSGTNTNAAIVNHTVKGYSLYCNACGFNPFHSKGQQTLEQLTRIRELNAAAEQNAFQNIELPHDFTEEIPIAGRLWLYNAGITETVWRKYGIGYSPSTVRVVLPVYDEQGNLIWIQQRAILEGQKPKYLQPSRDRNTIMFHATPPESDLRRAIIVEDILSAIRVGSHCPTYSLLGTKITTAQAAKLSKYSRVTTWLDGDKAGRRGAFNIRKSLGLLTNVDNIVTDKDPKLLSKQEIEEMLCR